MYLIKYSKVLIIGSGPSGSSSGIYLSRSNLNPILITGNNIGGQLIKTDIENWPGFIKISGYKLMNFILNQLKFMNLEIIFDFIYLVNLLIKPFLCFGKLNIFLSDFLIISKGSRPRFINNKYISSNISFCGFCDGNFYKNKDIVLIGGGNSAIENTIYLSFLSKKIILIHRSINFKVENILLKNLFKKKNLIFKLNFLINEFIGDSLKLKYLKIKNLFNNINFVIYLDALFMLIGTLPNTDIFLNQILINKNNYIIVKNNCFTNISGVFAAGDIQNFIYKQAIISSGFGVISALDLINYYNFIY